MIKIVNDGMTIGISARCPGVMGVRPDGSCVFAQIDRVRDGGWVVDRARELENSPEVAELRRRFVGAGLQAFVRDVELLYRGSACLLVIGLRPNLTSAQSDEIAKTLEGLPAWTYWFEGTQLVPPEDAWPGTAGV
jgi:hypothetical protein